jgi:VanZ family protein
LTPTRRPRAVPPPLLGIARWAAVLGWMALIFFLSAQPDLPHPQTGWADLLVSSASHALEFGILAVLLAFALDSCTSAPFRSRRHSPSPGQGGWGRRQVLLVAFLVTALYALSDEFHQSFVPGRVPDPWDLVCDGAGALVGLALWAAWQRPGERRRAVSPRG